ncbi:MAG: aldolase/citrate lyase family protein [Pseudomonadota bacterium]
MQSDGAGGGGARPGRPRRTWLFVPGADERAHAVAARSGADVLIQEREDFTPPELRPKARRLAATLYARCRAAGALAAVRINPLEGEGRDDLRAVLAARPDIVLMSKVVSAGQVRALEAATAGAVADAKWARRMGFRMKSIVVASHARALNRVFTPAAVEIARARRIVEAFERARARDADRARVAGRLVEVPIYAAAKRLLASAAHRRPRPRKTRG